MRRTVGLEISSRIWMLWFSRPANVTCHSLASSSKEKSHSEPGQDDHDQLEQPRCPLDGVIEIALSRDPAYKSINLEAHLYGWMQQNTGILDRRLLWHAPPTVGGGGEKRSGSGCCDGGPEGRRS